MDRNKITCSVCAWREHCKKKYYIKDPSRCPDFSRDLTISENNDGGKKKKDEN